MEIWSGGQTGGDQAALFAARNSGIKTGGWAPLGWLTEDGPAPWLADYGLRECPEEGYPIRTEFNVRDADVSVWFGDVGSSGFHCTRAACDRNGKPLWIVGGPGGIATPGDFVVFLKRDGFRRLNCCGNRASKARDLGARVDRFLTAVFRILQKEDDCGQVPVGADRGVRAVDRPVGAGLDRGG